MANTRTKIQRITIYRDGEVGTVRMPGHINKRYCNITEKSQSRLNTLMHNRKFHTTAYIAHGKLALATIWQL